MTTTTDPVRLEFYPDGTLHLNGRDGQWEPICSECGKPILWVLDMYSFTAGPIHRLAHAHCLWTKLAFFREANLVKHTKEPA